MAAQENNSAVAAVSGFFKAIGGFFADFGTAVVKGDAFVKLSLIWMGAGYAKRKQYVKAALMTLLEIAVIVFSVKFAMQYVPKFSTLGTVKMEKVFTMKTMKSEFMIMIIPLQSCCFHCSVLLCGLRRLLCGLRT